MKLGFLKSCAFFLLIESIFVLSGGGLSNLLMRVGVNKEEVIVNNLGFPFAGLIILLVIFRFFPVVFLKCRHWLSFTKKNFLFFIKIYILTGFCFSLVVLIGQITGLVQHSPVTGTLSFEILAVHLALTLFVGITEEFIYRGVLTAYFLDKNNKIITILFVSIFFSIGHLNYIGVLPYLNAFLMGVVSMILLFKTGTLFSAIGLHCSWNFFYFLLEKFYIYNVKIVPIWGNLFELYQISLYLLVIFGIVLSHYFGMRSKTAIKFGIIEPSYEET